MFSMYDAMYEVVTMFHSGYITEEESDTQLRLLNLVCFWGDAA